MIKEGINIRGVFFFIELLFEKELKAAWIELWVAKII